MKSHYRSWGDQPLGDGLLGFLEDEFLVSPAIREFSLGEVLRMRSDNDYDPNFSLGPPDLAHVSKYYGVNSLKYLNNEFLPPRVDGEDETSKRDDEGYVGFYHYLNGLSFTEKSAAVEKYMRKTLGLHFSEEGKYQWKNNFPVDLVNVKRDLTFTYCSYNIFTKYDFRAKYVMPTDRTNLDFKIHASYQIIPKWRYAKEDKVFDYNSETIRYVPDKFWEELLVSEVLRLFMHLDNPLHQITGLMSYSSIISSKKSLAILASLLVRFLPESHFLETRPSYGNDTGCTTKDKCGTITTKKYRNILIDCLVRVCALDLSGQVGDFAISEIRSGGGREWDFVILRLLKTLSILNKEKEYIQLIHDHLETHEIYNTQLGLIILEQAKYLISKGIYDKALKLVKISIRILPLDFDCWYMLTYCYIIMRNYKDALRIMNSLPVSITYSRKNSNIEHVSGIKDFYTATFIDRLNKKNAVIEENTFNCYFPKPKSRSNIYSRVEKKVKNDYALIDRASIDKVWNSLFLFNDYLRHPINGNYFYQSPLMNCSTKELSSVNHNLIRVCGPSSMRNVFSSQSSGQTSSSILNFENNSTWGKCYELLSFLVSIIGWDNVVRLAEEVFIMERKKAPRDFVVNRGSVQDKVPCSEWLEQLLFVFYEDIRTTYLISQYDFEERHSAVQWCLLGMLKWATYDDYTEVINSLITSIMGASSLGGFDYFGTVKLLEIYDELMLSDSNNLSMNNFYDDYEFKIHTHKLLLHSVRDDMTEYLTSIEKEYLNLDFILSILIKLVSWEVRWYQFCSNYLIHKIITKLCNKYDLIYIRSQLRIIFELNKLVKADRKILKKRFPLDTFFRRNSTVLIQTYDFVEDDTVLDFLEKQLDLIDYIKEEKIAL